MFRKLVGDENLRNVILATTRWEVTPYEDTVRREEELCTKDTFWNIIIAGDFGSKIRRLQNISASAAALVREILQSKEKTFVPKIQKEVMEEGKNLIATEVGAFINSIINKIKEIHKKKIILIKEKYKLALKCH